MKPPEGDCPGAPRARQWLVQRSPTATRILLILSMFVMGACGLMYEYVLSVLGNHLMGTSHEQIFIIIGLMLFAMGLGALVQRSVRRDLLDYFLVLEMGLGLLGGFSAVAIYGAFAFWESFEVVLYGFALLIGMCIGMEIPLLIRINRAYSASLRTNLAEILSVDYIGSLVGAFLFTYVFLANISLARIGFLLGAANILVACVSLYYFRDLLRHPKLTVGLATIAVPALLFGALHAEDWTQKAEQHYYRDPIIFRRTTKYQHIVLTRRDPRLNLYLNGNLQFSSMDEHIYHDYLVHVPMSVASSRARVLILGGGDGLALREVLKYRDVHEVVLVDIDPEVIRIAATQPDLVRINGGSFLDARVRYTPPGGITTGELSSVRVRSERRTQFFSTGAHPTGKVHLYFLDADRFVRTASGLFDVVLIDFPDPSMLELAKLYSLDFYRSLSRVLRPNAILAIQSTSPFFAREAFACIGRTLGAAGYGRLPYHGTVPTFAGDWGWHLAWKSEVNAQEMLRRIGSVRQFTVETPYLTAEVQRAAFVFGKGALDPEEPVRINTKMRPVLVDYYRKSWKGFD